MDRLWKLILWALIVAVFFSIGSESLRDVILPNDATGTDSTIIFIQLLTLEWMYTSKQEQKD